MSSTNSRNKCDMKRLALCQISPVIGDIETNKLKIVDWMRKAASCGADLALFGELATTGCELEKLHQVSETKDGPTAEALATAARELKIAVIYGYSEVENNNFYNSFYVHRQAWNTPCKLSQGTYLRRITYGVQSRRHLDSSRLGELPELRNSQTN